MAIILTIPEMLRLELRINVGNQSFQNVDLEGWDGGSRGRIYMCVCVCVRVYVYVYMCVCVCIYIYVYIYIYTYD